MTNLQFGSDSDVLHPRSNNAWLGGMQCLAEQWNAVLQPSGARGSFVAHWERQRRNGHDLRGEQDVLGRQAGAVSWVREASWCWTGTGLRGSCSTAFP